MKRKLLAAAIGVAMVPMPLMLNRVPTIQSSKYLLQRHYA